MRKVKAFILYTRLIGITALTILANASASGQENLSELLVKLQAAKNDSIKIVIYHQIADRYQYSKTDSVSACLQDGLRQFSAKNNRMGTASITSMLGFMDAHRGSIELARKRQSDALKIFEDINYQRGIATTNNALGIIDAKTGNFDAATKHFFVALKIFQSDSNRDGIISTYMNLGVINQIHGDLDKSLDYFNKGLGLIRDTNDVRSVCNLYNDIGIVYGKKGELARSLEYFQKALQKSSKPEYVDLQISALVNMGIVYQKFGDDENALNSSNAALQLADEQNHPEEYARLIVNVCSIVSKTNPAKAIVDLKRALEIARSIGQKALLEEIYESLVDDYKQIGNYKEAVVLMEQQRALEDSTFSIEKAKEIANLESVYQLEESNATIKELKLIQQKNLLRRNIIIAIAITLTIVLIITLFYFRKTRQLNEQLSRREAELEGSNKIKDKLFSIIGHDLRGPIGNIPMMLQILEDEKTDVAERKYLHETLMTHVQASKETLDKLLYWGNSQIKGYQVKPEVFNTSDYIQKDINLLKSSAAQKKITIVNKTANDTRIIGEPAHFDFILRNLLSNAIKFTNAEGSVEISTDRNRIAGFTVFAIKDNGIGVPKEKLSHIFEPFASSTKGTADEPGTSIGLMLCKEFVTENGGAIWLESEPGKGSTFYFSFRSA